MKIKLIVSVIALMSVVAWWYFTSNQENPVVFVEQIDLEELPEKPIKTMESYFPIVQDTLWQYSEVEDASYTLNATLDFIKDDIFQMRYDDGEYVRIKVFLQEEDILYEVAMEEDAFVKNDYTLYREYKDIVLQLPLEVGKSWTLGDGAIRTITAVDKVVPTGMGDLNVVEVTTTHEDYETVEMYAENIGPVSYSYKDSLSEQSFVIDSYELNRPIVTSIAVHYPNQTTNGLEIIQQEVSVMTNEEARHFLTDVLSMEPREELLRPLPVDAQINTIFIQQEEMTAYVDLSSHYKEYTPDEEALAVKSVVNTIGNYYGVDYVTLTVGSEVYRDTIEVGE